MSGVFHAWEQREIADQRGLEERRLLLESRGLAVPSNANSVLGFYDDDRLVATGSLVDGTLQGLAVAEDYEGEGAAATVVTALVKVAMARGLQHLFLYTKPKERARFEELGFSLLASVEPASDASGDIAQKAGGQGAALLEWGTSGIDAWCRQLAREAEGRPKNAGAVVMNANPFTLGHRYLLERAAAAVPWLYILIVEEDLSLFSFATRLELVRRGSRDLANTTVLPGGPYVISASTFPSYFLRARGSAETDAAAWLHAAIDLMLFRDYIAPSLGVTERFVGNEPYCPTTSVYNACMKAILPGTRNGVEHIQVRELPRIEEDGIPVSASRVRELIRSGSLEEVRRLVPASTWEWLASPDAAPTLERIRTSDSRH